MRQTCFLLWNGPNGSPDGRAGGGGTTLRVILRSHGRPSTVCTVQKPTLAQVREKFPIQRSVQIEVANGFAGVGRFLGPFDGLLEFFFQQLRSVLLGLYRLAEDR